MRAVEEDGYWAWGRFGKPVIALEICVGSVEHAVAAEQAGADRIELCAGLAVGGTTPSVALIRAVRSSVRLPIHAMIRPRGGDFVYSAGEFAAMRKDIRAARECGMDGMVLGILDAGRRVDVVRTGELVELAGLPVTFHRAFDEVGNFSEALEAVIAAGARRVLTSGGAARALEGIVVLEQLVKWADGRISILPGVGIDAGNVVQIVRATKVCEVHASLGLVSGLAGKDGVDEWAQRVRGLRAKVDGIGET